MLKLCVTHAGQGHSGASSASAAALFVKLVNREPLTKLTSDPDEWIDRTELNDGEPNVAKQPRHVGVQPRRRQDLVQRQGGLMSVDPQLKRCREEIDAVLQKYGASAAIVMTRPAKRQDDMSGVNVEQWIHLADWMMASFTPRGALQLHIRKAERERSEQTVGTFQSFVEGMGPWVIGFADTLDAVEAERGTVHKRGRFVRGRMSKDAVRMEMGTFRALNRLAKWRTLLTGWQLGTPPQRRPRGGCGARPP